MSLFDDLPLELLHVICTFCSKSEIRSLRLTSKLLATIADEHFLHEVVLFFAREDFETAESIIDNSRIAKNVKRLTFQSDRVPWLGPDFGLWNEFRKQSVRSTTTIEGPEPPDTTFVPDETDRERRFRLRQPNRSLVLEENKHSRKELRAAYDHYNLLSEDQNEMMLEHRAEECIEYMFQKCSKLDTVIVAMNDHHPAWRSVEAFRKGMIHPCGDNATSRLGVRSLNEVLMAAQATGRKPSSLHVYPISFQFFGQTEEHMEHIYKAISGLKTIDLKINTKIAFDRELDIDIDDDDDDETIAAKVEQFERQAERESYWDASTRVTESFRDGRLARFLSKAPLLEHIAVAGIRTYLPDLMIDLKDIIPSPQWPAIRVLDLQCFQCPEQDLLDLVLKYRDSLQELRLGQVLLTKGDPNSFFQALAGQCPNLKSVGLSGMFMSRDIDYNFEYWRTTFTAAMEKYLICGGELPRLSTYTSVSLDLLT
ncbi:uncharacterized protein RCC_05516 [Ramularia collo-cygni]|uniref:F-box domain-containing protein n=1 Tax=Ramularia collo-cygni TaxID=112498 RepID=A0A2D3UZ17_9PEZI|nr:uncharacterized protein RCC_05516 [Ramularia collo-cygni]CZT19665.1 uncharacterized protein RCC_05516 [Ramularia collo-cygni]